MVCRLMRWPHSLRALKSPDLRAFFLGHAISLTGGWMQSLATGWLVYRLTQSSVLLGLTTFMSQVPIFFLSIYAGALADRLPRRTLVMMAQGTAMLQALVLAALTFSGQIAPWHLVALSVLLGLSSAFDIPARHALVADLAGSEASNAVALNSTVVNVTRILGPAIAGYVVALWGEAWCFLLNGLSFGAVLYAVYRARESARVLVPNQHQNRVAEGIGYALSNPPVRAVLLLLVVSSFFGIPYITLLPAIAQAMLDGGATLLGKLHSAAGVGALVAALSLLQRRSTGGLEKRIGVGAVALGLGVLGTSLSMSRGLTLVALGLAGFGFITQMASTMTLLQESCGTAMRGRLMGLYSMLFSGVAPFGALWAGWMAQHHGVGMALGIGALAVLAGAALFFLALFGQPRAVGPAAAPR